MEETMMYGRGLRELHSSELQVRGGATKSVFASLFEKFRNLIDTIADYLPKLVSGLKDGFSGNSFI